MDSLASSLLHQNRDETLLDGFSNVFYVHINNFGFK